MLPNPILLVDDSQFFLEVFKFELLKHLDVQIGLATTADVGLGLLSQTDYDLLLMDVMMPGTDGVLAAHKFNQRNPTLPIILMSAAEPQALGRMGYAVEALDKFTFIGKPKSCMISGMVNATLRETQVNQTLTPSAIADVLLSLSANGEWKI